MEQLPKQNSKGSASTQLAKTLCLPYYAHVFSSTKLVIKAEQDLSGTEGGRVEMMQYKYM
jgi:hypothetical protein